MFLSGIAPVKLSNVSLRIARWRRKIVKLIASAHPERRSAATSAQRGQRGDATGWTGTVSFQRFRRLSFSCTCDIYSVVHVRDLVNGAAVNSHPHLNLRMVLECLHDFQCTTRRLFEIFEEQ